MTEIAATPVAFEEAISFLKRKVRIPSKRWDELVGEIHAKAFTVAGATKTQLLADLHEAAGSALSEGQSIGEFRKAFDTIADKHGWSYKGHRNWRTRVIYDTNMRTAHMAGRWEQIQRTKERRPYLQYLTAGDTRVRPEHAKWDNAVLLIDDEWWSTHYPPNGWGCRCTVRTLSQSQMEREGLTTKSAPRVEMTERMNTRTGEVYGDVPTGIDTGWDYNVGKAWLGPDQALGSAVAALPPGIRKAALDSLQNASDRIAAPFEAWAKEVFKTETAGSQAVVGYLSNRSFQFLVDEGITPQTATITLLDHHLRRMVRDVARRTGKATIPEDVLLDIPNRIAKPQAVLWDKRKGNLAFVTTVESERSGRLVVSIDYTKKGQPTNAVISGGLVDRVRLRDESNYTIIEGNP